MIYLSAQPDAYFFYWQLELLFESLLKINVPRDEIHVLIGYDPNCGMSSYGKYFIEENSDKANIFAYPDLRENKIYVSSIRPHIIKQHFSTYDWLSTETIFYHDSDIVFTEKRIDFSIFEKDDYWYASDTGTYLNADYIKSTLEGEFILESMCKIVGVTKESVEAINDQTGGAQYLLKNVDSSFWDKVERDSENLYLFFKSCEKKYGVEGGKRKSDAAADKRLIQGWCSDMWAVLWNGIYFGHPIKVAASLEFMWPVYNKSSWENSSIYHDAGVVGNLVTFCFDKKKFKENPPYYYHHKHVDPDSCSSKYVDLFYDFIAKKKYDLSDSTFVLIIEDDITLQCKKMLSVTLEYFDTHFITNILIVQKRPIENFEPVSKYSNLIINFIVVDDPIYNSWGKISNLVYGEIETANVVHFKLGYFISPQQILRSIVAIRDKKNILICPADKVINVSNQNIRDEFFMTADIRALNSTEYSSAEHVYGTNLIWNNYTAFRIEDLMEIGRDNENINNIDLIGLDRAVRFQLKGYEIHCYQSNLYNLNEIGLSENYEIAMVDEIECIKLYHSDKNASLK